MNDSTEKIVYFVRHGQSEDNIAPVFQAPESPLSKAGERQAEFIARRASKVSFDALISSPLPRTKQTAAAISKATGVKPVYSDLLVESIKPITVFGRPYTDKTASDIWRKWAQSQVTPGMKVEDGENFEEINTRAGKALDYLYGRPEKSLLVVTHGYFLRTIVAKVLLGDELTPRAFAHFQKVVFVENTGITVLAFEGAFEQEPCWRLKVFNDHAHLAE